MYIHAEKKFMYIHKIFCVCVCIHMSFISIYKHKILNVCE